MPNYSDVSQHVIRRLPRYYHHLTELEKNGTERISSREFAEMIGFTASQIRQDLNCFGGFGQQGYGYNVAILRTEIGRILSVDKAHPAIIIGAGHLGFALASNMNFSYCGFRLVGVFDVAPELIGQEIGDCTVHDIAQLRSFCTQYKPQVAAICTPPSAVPELVSTLADLGVRGLWNFTQCDIQSFFSGDVVIENVQLSDSLMSLSFNLNSKLEDV